MKVRSTGEPKGAELTHANLRSGAIVSATTLLDLGPGDAVMGCLPLFHCVGQTCGLNSVISSGRGRDQRRWARTGELPPAVSSVTPDATAKTTTVPASPAHPRPDRVPGNG